MNVEIEHPNVTHAMQTGYERGKAPPVVPWHLTRVWQAQEVRHEDAFPYVPHEEREE